MTAEQKKEAVRIVKDNGMHSTQMLMVATNSPGAIKSVIVVPAGVPVLRNSERSPAAPTTPPMPSSDIGYLETPKPPPP